MIIGFQIFLLFHESENIFLKIVIPQCVISDKIYLIHKSIIPQNAKQITVILGTRREL